MERLWTVAEAARYLNVTDRDVAGLVNTGRLTGYTLGGKFLRVRPQQVQTLKGAPEVLAVAPLAPAESPPAAAAVSIRDRLLECIYFYDGYACCAILLLALIVYLVASGRG